MYWAGEFYQNRLEGHGRYVYKSGEVYEGQQKNGIRHGCGTLFRPDGTIEFEGEWVNGNRHVAVNSGNHTHSVPLQHFPG